MALVGWVALIAQLNLTLGLVAAKGGTYGEAIWHFIAYFTVLTNMLVALTATRVALGQWPGGAQPSASALTAVVIAIAVVGVVYRFVLSPRGPDLVGFAAIVDVALHEVEPVLAALFWVLFVPKRQLTFVDPFYWIAYPIAYLAYALVRGALEGWYPYFFIDVTKLGLGQVLVNAGLLTCAMLGFGYLLVGAVWLATSRVR
jgi:hypothetical protein